MLSLLCSPTRTSVHDYWENHSFDCIDFVRRVISLLFNKLSRFVITFLPKSKNLLIPWLQSLSAVILEPKEIKSATVSTVSPFICHEVMGPDAMILVFLLQNPRGERLHGENSRNEKWSVSVLCFGKVVTQETQMTSQTLSAPSTALLCLENKYNCKENGVRQVYNVPSSSLVRSMFYLNSAQYYVTT